MVEPRAFLTAGSKVSVMVAMTDYKRGDGLVVKWVVRKVGLKDASTAQ
jgi:hypothetical protein